MWSGLKLWKSIVSRFTWNKKKPLSSPQPLDCHVLPGHKDDSSSIVSSTCRGTINEAPEKVPGHTSALDVAPPHPEAPRWFLEHCVQTNRELQKAEIPLTITTPRSEDNSPAEHVDVSTTVSLNDSYMIDTNVYESLPRLLLSTTANTHDSQDRKEQASTSASQTFFTHDAACIAIPSRTSQGGGSTFLRAVVKRFARDVGADLVTLFPEDIDDLMQYFENPERLENAPIDIPVHCTDAFASPASNDSDIDSDSDSDSDDGSNSGDALDDRSGHAGFCQTHTRDCEISPFAEPCHSPIARFFALSSIVSSPAAKASQAGTITEGSRAPLIIHLVSPAWTEHRIRFMAEILLPHLQLDSSFAGSHLVILSFPQTTAPRDMVSVPLPFGYHGFPNLSSVKALLEGKNIRIRPRAISLAPVSSPQQHALMHCHDVEHASSPLWSNIRYLKRIARRKCVELEDLPILQPLASWAFLAGTALGNKLDSRGWSFGPVGMEPSDFSGLMRPGFTDEDVKAELLRMSSRLSALGGWYEKTAVMGHVPFSPPPVCYPRRPMPPPPGFHFDKDL